MIRELASYWGRITTGEKRKPYSIRQPQPIGDRLFKIEFLDSGIETFAFTFG
jgi:hypothetical protein